LARRLGWTDEQIEHLANFDNRRDFDESEKATLRLAEIETRDPRAFDGPDWADLRKHFDEGQIIELVSTIGLFKYFNRVNDVLRVEPTK
jgi:alkylhydroperoxidase family enzyme